MFFQHQVGSITGDNLESCLLNVDDAWDLHTDGEPNLHSLALLVNFLIVLFCYVSFAHYCRINSLRKKNPFVSKLT